MSGRAWTDEEVDVLRTTYRRGAAARIARRFGRSVDAVRQKALLLGLLTYSYRRSQCPEELQAFIAARHAAGELDVEIARAWNAEHPDRQLTRRGLAYVRTRMGLATHLDRIRERRQFAQRRQLEVLGVATFGDLARRARRRASIQSGWPFPVRPLEARVLDVLASGERMTRAEIASAIGHDHREGRHYFKTKYGSRSALANLVSRGFVRRSQGRIRRGTNKGHSAYEYWIPLDVLASRRPRTCSCP